MTTALAEPTLDRDLAEFAARQAMIAELKARFADAALVPATESAGYENRRLAVKELREFRGEVERTRKALKAESLNYGRKVDNVARQLTAAAEAIEQPLKIEMQAVDDAKLKAAEAERLRLQADREAAEKARIQALESELRQRREADEARMTAEREAAEKRMRDDAAARFLAQAQEAERLRVEREALAAERKRIEAEQVQCEAEGRKERARMAAEVREYAYKAARHRIARVEAARLEALQPDIEKQDEVYQQILELVEDWNKLQQKIDKPGRLEVRIL